MGILLASDVAAAGAGSPEGFWDARFHLPGINGEVRAIGTEANHLYAVGDFTAVGNVPVTNIARWDGTNWSALGSGLNGTVYALACGERELFAGGTFSSAGGLAASNIARWDGTTWSALARGIEGGTVLALAAPNGDLLAGGRFGSAGGKPASNFSLWRFPPRLHIARRGEAVQLSWPAVAGAGYVVQAADTLSSPGWRPITNPPVVLGGEASLIESRSSRSSFYRLVRE